MEHLEIKTKLYKYFYFRQKSSGAIINCSNEELQTSISELITVVPKFDYNTYEKTMVKIIKLYVYPFDVPATFKNRVEYAKSTYEHAELEEQVDRLRGWAFSSSPFRFNMQEQKEVTSRIVITVQGDKKITDDSVLAIKIPYRTPK